VFEQEHALDKLEAFTSLSGPAFYGLAPNDSKLTLQKHDTPVNFLDKIDTDIGPVTVFDPGFALYWSTKT
jgi:dihydroorotase